MTFLRHPLFSYLFIKGALFMLKRYAGQFFVAFLLIIQGLSTLNCSAQSESMDSFILTSMKKERIPGIVVGIIRSEKLQKLKAYGFSDVELQCKATPENLFEIGSLTKQFTAACVLMLEKEHKLNVDDPVGKYLNNLPKIWQDISLRRLLTHTSGIPNYTNVVNLQILARAPHTADEILKIVSDKPLDFPSGSKWEYSNTNYYLLGLVVEKVSGKKLEEFMRERIFIPLGMKSTRACNPDQIIKYRSCGYNLSDKLKLQNAVNLEPTAAMGAGFLISTVSDLSKWEIGLETAKILDKKRLEEMYTPAALNDGAKAGYGFGLALGQIGTHPVIDHTGGTIGFASVISRYPKDNLSIIMLCNQSSANIWRLQRELAAKMVPYIRDANKPIKDADPTRSERLRMILNAFIHQQLNDAWFTKDMLNALTPDKKKWITEYLSSQGKIKSFALISIGKVNGFTVLKYKTQFVKQHLLITFSLDSSDKVAGFFLSPTN
jgi:CubicO group peptidase (beta-lactamase class C family)